MTFTIAAKAR